MAEEEKGNAPCIQDKIRKFLNKNLSVTGFIKFLLLLILIDYSTSIIEGHSFMPMDRINIYFAIGTLFFGLYQGLINERLLKMEKERGEREHKRELILDYYPGLIQEFKDSIHMNESLIQGIYSGTPSSHFRNLLGMDKDDTLRIIENIDKNLSEFMRIIIDDLLPSLDKIDEERICKMKVMNEIWLTALSEIFKKFNGLTEFNILITEFNFVQRVYSIIIWKLWTKDSKEAKTEFMKIVRDINEATPGLISDDLSEKIYEKFYETANEEFEPTRNKMIEKGRQLKTGISEDILPIMNARMSAVVQ